MMRNGLGVCLLAVLASGFAVSPTARAQILIAPGEVMPPFEGGTFLRGDANGDRRFDISDPSFTLNFLFRDGATPPCMAAADGNDDERIDISDGVIELLALFQGGVLPPPWPRPGEDPTPGLPCGDPDRELEPSAEDEQEGTPLDAQQGDGESFASVELRWDGDELAVVGAKVLAGPLVTSDRLQGEFVYEICDAAGACLSLGSLDDPRLERGVAQPRRGEQESDHYFGIAPAGVFTARLSLPRDGLDLAGLRARLLRRNGLTAAFDTLDAAAMEVYRTAGFFPEGETAPGTLGRAVAAAIEVYERDGPLALVAPTNPFRSASVTPLLVNGSSGSKKDLVILGDGFAAEDQTEYNELVDELIMEGPFGHDVFQETASAFNIYRVNLVSQDSGLTLATHTQFETNEIEDPEDLNLHPGTISIDIPSVGVIALPVAGENRSLDKVRQLLEKVKFNSTDGCGNWVEHAFKVRLIIEEKNIDADAAEETVGTLWIGAPKGLPGEDGDFSMTFIPQSGRLSGELLSFQKTATGSMVEKDTALEYIYTDHWDYCWLQSSCETSGLLDQALELVPDSDYVVIILNRADGGGCGGGGRQVFAKGVSWAVVAHEFGHGIGGLADEYTKSRTYTGDRPKSPNLDNVTDIDEIKWKDYIDTSTPLPTELADVDDSNQACGAFEGGGSYSKDIYRPVHNCRMKVNTPEFCPVCYTQIRELLFPFQELHFFNCYSGDFNGDGKDDLVQHAGTTLALFLSNGLKLEPASVAAEHIPGGGWRIRRNDRYFVADFNGDGKDDLYVFNGDDWSEEYLGCLRSTGSGFTWAARYDDAMNGWDFKPGDGFVVGDFNADGREDLYVHNGTDWGPEYLGMLRSSGGGLSVVRRYDDAAPGWDMGNRDRYVAGDFNGDGKTDLFVQNTLDWGSNFVGMLRSNGTSLTNLIVYEDSLDGWEMGNDDVLYPADFDGDGRTDLYVFNGHTWTEHYLGMFRSEGSSLDWVRLYSGSAPGWDLEEWDRFHVADVNGDGKDDLYVQNVFDWGHDYVGILRSTGSALTGMYHEDVLGLWSLDDQQSLLPGDFNGDGKDDLVIRNVWWLGLFRSTGSALEFKRRYFHWIHNFLYHGPLGHNENLDLTIGLGG